MRQLDVAIVGNNMQFSIGGEVVKISSIRHDRSKEDGEEGCTQAGEARRQEARGEEAARRREKVAVEEKGRAGREEGRRYRDRRRARGRRAGTGDRRDDPALVRSLGALSGAARGRPALPAAMSTYLSLRVRPTASQNFSSGS